MHAAGKSDVAIAAAVGATPRAVRDFRRDQLKLPGNNRSGGRGRLFTPEQDAAFLPLFARYASFAEIQAVVNAMPGGRLENKAQIREWAKRARALRNSAAKPVRMKEISAVVRHKSQEPLELRLLIVRAAQLREHGIRVRDMTDVDEVSRAWRRVYPEHPGFVIRRPELARISTVEQWGCDQCA